MLVRNKKTFSVGVVFAISFLSVLFMIFSPMFGDGKNGLVFSDDIFNKLSKGSSYFIPKVAKSVEKVKGTPLSVSINLDKAEEAENFAKLFTAAGAAVNSNGADMTIKGDLGTIL